jgi:lysophospholipase L1-like esterase
MTRHHFSFLALGDSYTVGENIPVFESFPYQVVQLLRNKGLLFNAPEIAAKTGWTTGELAEHILHTKLLEKYDFVSLLIGVNNQYRSLPIEEYAADFEYLLKKAIHLTDEQASHVIVLSIPDWSVTPHAEGSNITKVAAEIDAFNEVNARLAKQYGVHYIDVTTGIRQNWDDLSQVASDGLHLSGKVYARWAADIAEYIMQLTTK